MGNLYFQNSDQLVVQPEIHAQETPHLMLDIKTDTFVEVPKTPASIDSLLRLGHQKRTQHPRLSYHVIREALNLAQQIGYLDGESKAHNLIAIKYSNFGDYEMALKHNFASLEIEEKSGNELRVAGLYSNIAIIYLDQEDYDRAIEFLRASIQKMNEIGQPRQAMFGLNNLGLIYVRYEKYDTALEFFRQAESLSLEAPADSLLYMLRSK